MTIWSTHAQLSEGGSMLKHLPPLDDLFDFEKDSVDRTVNWAENAPTFGLWSIDADDYDHADEDDTRLSPTAADLDRMSDEEWLTFKTWGPSDDDVPYGEVAGREFDDEGYLIHKPKRPSRRVERAMHLLRNCRADWHIAKGRHTRGKVRVSHKKDAGVALRLLRCNADFTAHVKQCLGRKKMRRAA